MIIPSTQNGRAAACKTPFRELCVPCEFISPRCVVAVELETAIPCAALSGARIVGRLLERQAEGELKLARRAAGPGAADGSK